MAMQRYVAFYLFLCYFMKKQGSLHTAERRSNLDLLT